jgi:biopolymer transport protein ExbB
MSTLYNNFWELMNKGGYVMWPLLLLSLVSMTLAFERCWFWLRTNKPGRVKWIRQVCSLLRAGKVSEAAAMARADDSVYGQVIVSMLAESYSDALAAEAVESQRSRLDRFMPTLSTIITAAPMLGILGTVTGIISSFQVLSTQMATTDPRGVSSGIAEALLTTVAGLVVALFTLFFFSAFSAQVDRTLGRLETIIASVARASAVRPAGKSGDSPVHTTTT